MTMERKRLDQYFDTPSEERQAKHAFVDSITSLINDSDKRCEQPDLEFQSKLTSVYLQRHQHDRELAKSMIYSLTRNPAYMTFDLKDWKWNSSNYPLAGGYLQDPRSVPLLHDLKQQFTNFSFEKGYYSCLVVEIHMLLESGRSYLSDGHPTRRTYLTPGSERFLLVRR
jgi:hypothetical protein